MIAKHQFFIEKIRHHGGGIGEQNIFRKKLMADGSQLFKCLGAYNHGWYKADALLQKKKRTMIAVTQKPPSAIRCNLDVRTSRLRNELYGIQIAVHGRCESKG